ncbi:MAG: hypothetical protein ACO3F2_13515 [Roseiflexaceae bacterium]|jgi:hypothetical protein
MLTTVLGIIIAVIGVVVAIVWLIRYINSAYTRALTKLADYPRDEAVIHRVIQLGRNYYFEHETYHRLPANSLLQNMSVLNELRERNPFLHDEKIKKDMRNATRINYENFFPKRPQPDTEPARKS